MDKNKPESTASNNAEPWRWISVPLSEEAERKVREMTREERCAFGDSVSALVLKEEEPEKKLPLKDKIRLARQYKDEIKAHLNKEKRQARLAYTLAYLKEGLVEKLKKGPITRCALRDLPALLIPMNKIMLPGPATTSGGARVEVDGMTHADVLHMIRTTFAAWVNDELGAEFVTHEEQVKQPATELQVQTIVTIAFV